MQGLELEVVALLSRGHPRVLDQHGPFISRNPFGGATCERDVSRDCSEIHMAQHSRGLACCLRFPSKTLVSGGSGEVCARRMTPASITAPRAWRPRRLSVG